MKTAPQDIRLHELRETGEISVRSYNVCGRAKIITVQDMHEYLLKNEDFINIKNCGQKSNKELLGIYRQYFWADNLSKSEEPNVPALVKSLEFEDVIECAFKKLSVRAQNALLDHFKKKSKWDATVKKHFIDKDFSATQLRNVGAKTAIEISGFIDLARDVYTQMETINESPVEVTRYELKKLTGIIIKEPELLQKFNENKFPLCIFAKTYLDNVFNLDEVESVAVKSLLGLLHNPIPLEEISHKAGLTKERVRQKRHKAIGKIEKSALLKSLLPSSHYHSVFTAKPPFIVIPSDLNDVDITNECLAVGNLFATVMLGAMYGEHYYSLTAIDRLIKPDDIYAQETYNKCKRLKGNYVVNKDIIPKEELVRVISDVLKLACERHQKNTLVSLEEFVLTLDENLISLLKRILHIEFQLEIQGQSIQFPRNTPKLVYEYAEEALERIGKPAHVSEVSDEINKYNGELSPAENSVRVAMQKQKDIFIFFGRTSTFGLKKWQSTSKNIKGGTIRDIVEEYLGEFDHPCHISAITKHVNRYRKTDEASVINNLKVTVEKRFAFFKDGYVGLASRDYNSRESGRAKKLADVSLDDLLSSIFSK